MILCSRDREENRSVNNQYYYVLREQILRNTGNGSNFLLYYIEMTKFRAKPAKVSH